MLLINGLFSGNKLQATEQELIAHYKTLWNDVYIANRLAQDGRGAAIRERLKIEKAERRVKKANFLKESLENALTQKRYDDEKNKHMLEQALNDAKSNLGDAEGNLAWHQKFGKHQEAQTFSHICQIHQTLAQKTLKKFREQYPGIVDLVSQSDGWGIKRDREAETSQQFKLLFEK